MEIKYSFICDGEMVTARNYESLQCAAHELPAITAVCNVTIHKQDGGNGFQRKTPRNKKLI